MKSNTKLLKYTAPEKNRNGKHIVLIANDHEYRSEEAIPALARILTFHHGFDTTVIFGLDKDGKIRAGAPDRPGTEALDKADLMIIAARFINIPDAQIKPIHDYIQRGGPIIGLRTSTHAFKLKPQSVYMELDFRQKDEAHKGGFGHQILGQSWVGHYGTNHKQSTRIDLIEDKKHHPILSGVKNAWVQAGGYNAEPQADWDILAMAQPLLSMKPDGKDDPKKPAMAGHWTRHYTTADGQKHRVVTSLYGASEDFTNDGYRRMILNSVFWSLSMEKDIKPDLNIDFLGDYKPTTFKTGGALKGISPSDYQDPKSTIPRQ